MKTVVLTIWCLVLCAGFAFSQDFPVTGSWRLQIIGTAQEFPVEIDGNVWTIETDGSSIPQIVTVDNDEKTVVIPLFAMLADYYFFEVKDGYVDLKAGGKFNMPLIDMMRDSVTELEGINGVTDAFVETFVMEIESIFHQVPIMRLYRK
jgi:hypothetical protein